jgi:hypothetical protein
MGGSVALPLVVEVAFGAEPLDTGTLMWTDISAYVKRSAGIDFSRGWDTEAAEPLAGRLTFTVNNDDGDFTPGATGAFGLIRNRLPVRVSAVIGTATGNALTYDEAVGWYDMLGATYDDAEIGVVVLWTGLVESWRQSWENGVRSQVAVTCVDRWAAIRRLKFDGKQIERIVTAHAPTDFWTLTADKTEQDRAEPTIGTNLLDAKTATSGILLAPDQPNPQAWRTDVGAYTPGVSIPPTASDNPTFVTSETSLLPTGSASIAFSVTGWVREGRINVIAPSILVTEAVALQVLTGTAYVSLARSGGAGAENYKTASANSGWHHLAVTCSVNGSGACTLNFYLDGASIGSDTTWSSSGWTVATPWMRFYTATGGAVAYAALWDRALTAAEVLAQYQAGSALGVTGETAAVRAARLLTYTSPAPSLTTTGTFTATMSQHDLPDKSLADALFECATAERGTIYTSRDGWPVLTSRSWRVASPVAFTIPATALAADVTFTLDDQQLTNSATVDRMVGAESAGTVRARNDASVATYGEQNKTLQVWLDTDAQLLDRANAEANIDAVAQPRSSDLMVDIMSKSATVSASTLLAADIGQRIAVSGLPAEAPSTDEFYIETIADRVTHTGWERTFTVSPRADYWTLQDATYGQIDDVFVLAF